MSQRLVAKILLFQHRLSQRVIAYSSADTGVVGPALSRHESADTAALGPAPEEHAITSLHSRGLPSEYRARLSSERPTVKKSTSPPPESSSLTSQTRLRRLRDTRENSASAAVHTSRTPPFASTRDQPEIVQRTSREHLENNQRPHGGDRDASVAAELHGIIGKLIRIV